VTPRDPTRPPYEASERLLGRLSGDRGLHNLRRVAWILFVLAVAVFLIRGADRPKDPKLLPASGSAHSAVSPFGQVGFTVLHPANGVAAANASHCALLAQTPAQREQGLMNRKNLGGYEGMLFTWQAPATDQFYMLRTLIPLSIAWFDSGGKFLSTADMAPCAKEPCQRYPAPSPYSVALEVPQGLLSYIGIGPGSAISVGGPC
jgi:uncharacterized membrane protein (UPF0127 family)